MDNYIEKRREVMVVDNIEDFLLSRNLQDTGCYSAEMDRIFRFRTPVDFGNSSN